MIDPMPQDIFQTGQILNNTYEIVGVLGRGGTGEVYLARNQVVDRQVAIKALNSQFSGNADYIELMKREEEMRNIVHDSVVRYSECSMSDQNHVFLVMEFVDGISLNDLMMERRLDDKELLIVAHRVLEGLVHVHKAGIVHRDLSPDNIILRGGAPERATIIDFGIAKDTASGARTIVGNDFAGKYEYAAPEQLEGKAEYRTDLYSLGASLLAAFRRDIPFPGATPGEIIRRKQDAIDTSGVSEPLKGLIDWLTAPKLDDRPRDATEALARVDECLKPAGLRRAPTRKSSKPKSAGGSKALRLGFAVAFLVVLTGLWAGGVLDGFAPAKLPVAAPYQLEAFLAQDGTGQLTANAPDEATALEIRRSFESASGLTTEPSDVTLATGLPSLEWPVQMDALMQLAGTLESWDLSVSDLSARLTGLAPDITKRASAQSQFQDWSAKTGIALNSQITAGPRILSRAALQAELAKYSNCGMLIPSETGDGIYPLFETITITGDLARREEMDKISQALAEFVGDRNLRLDTTLLNEDLCAIRSVLPVANSANLSIWLGDGATGAASATGVFRTRQNPVVEVHIPAGITQGSLWVMVVDNTGKVFHVLPNITRTEQDVANLGTVENGVRQVRVLFSVEEFKQDTSRLALQVNEGDYGKSEVIAILSKSNLFDMRRPRDESVTSVAQALEEALKGHEDEIIGVASRIIDARP